ncbi:uncharacterized protein [Rutidosis leptorrhynchoides]|uniref:uncharacterized protein n=1 Tax=Rutidosis leptorrhynchoides TaxID=125765 RepID=UPI003A9A5BA3
MKILTQVIVLVVLYIRITSATWCVVRSEASRESLQAALDYACGAGADCAPIQQTGLCFLPNTIQAHASYAFNSYFMRSSMAPGSCNFAGTATIAKTDPSYGSCNYPASPRTAGGTPISGGSTSMITTPTSNTTPLPLSTTAPLFGSGEGLNPNRMVQSNARASMKVSILRMKILNMLFLVFNLWFFF